MTEAEKELAELCGETLESLPVVELRKKSAGVDKVIPEVDPSKPLKNALQERFAQGVARGEKADMVVYQEVYQCTRDAAEASASRVRGYAGVAKRIEYLQEKAASAKVMSQREAMEWLSDAVRTPIAEIDEQSPLAQEVEYKEDGSRKIKSVPKLGAIEQLAKLAGWGNGQNQPGVRLRVVATSAGVAAEIDTI